VNVLIDLQHPAHLHFFRHVAKRLQDEGHRVLFTGRDKDILVELARELDIEVDVFGTARKGTLQLGKELLYRQGGLCKRIRTFKPDLMMAIAGTFISTLGKLLRIPVYVFYDTEHATVSNLLAYPFATCTYVPRCYRKEIRWRHHRYNGYHELAYLHPRYFTPDPSVLADVGLQEGEVFSIVRFVGWGAAHDIGLQGFSGKGKHEAIRRLAQYGRVLISCEGELPADLEDHRLRLPVSRMHDLMAYASLIFGESATMCSEGAVLGVPGVYVDPVGRGYTDEQEQDYGLVSNFTSAQEAEAIDRGEAILKDYNRVHWQAQGKKLLADKIDVTEMLYQIVMSRPEIYQP
jgi:hypothetical protein